VAHQGVPVASLPGLQSGGFFSSIAQAAASPSVVGSPSPASAMARPAPMRTSARPQAAGGLDGWLVDRLFGR
jgi:penicillin-binding protein 1A